jgi:hypothetical protein
MATDWVDNSETKQAAHRYFMKQFFIQNADIIAGDSGLSPFFADQLDDRPISANAYIEFAEAVGNGSVRKCGFIVDEAQTLVAAAESGIGKDGYPIIDRDGFPVNKPFFKTDFTVWAGPSRHFCSQLCANGCSG